MARYCVGIDQSFTNTGVCALDLTSFSVVALDSFGAPLLRPDYDSNCGFISSLRGRVDTVISNIETFLLKFPASETVVALEYLASGNKSKDTDYFLSHLFFEILSFLSNRSYRVMMVSPLTHRKVFLPKVSGNKADLFREYWETSFSDAGFASSFTFENDDQRDAFCLAYFSYLRISLDKSLIFGKRTPKEKKSYPGKLYEAVFHNICFETRKSRKCWRCPLYSDCSVKDKYRPPKTKKEAVEFVQQQNIGLA